jgi:hypothetical protein
MVTSSKDFFCINNDHLKNNVIPFLDKDFYRNLKYEISILGESLGFPERNSRSIIYCDALTQKTSVVFLWGGGWLNTKISRANHSYSVG